MSNHDAIGTHLERAEETLMPDLPEDARVWIYGSDRPLTAEEEVTILQRMHHFLDDWTSHGRDVAGDAAVLRRRFLIIGAHIPSGDISGCGIDKSSRVVAALAEELGLEWTSALHVFFRDEAGDIRCVTRPHFRSMARSGKVTPRTEVFDCTVETVGGIRGGKFARDAADSWHGRAFGLTLD